MRGYVTATCVLLTLCAILASARPRPGGVEAAARASVTADVPALRRALDSGVDLNAAGGRLLCYAAASGDDAAVELLLERGVKADASLGGSTALMVAAFRGNVPVVRRLLRAGADPALRNAGGETPLELALREDHREVAALLAAAGDARPRPHCHAPRRCPFE